MFYFRALTFEKLTGGALCWITGGVTVVFDNCLCVSVLHLSCTKCVTAKAHQTDPIKVSGLSSCSNKLWCLKWVKTLDVHREDEGR